MIRRGRWALLGVALAFAIALAGCSKSASPPRSFGVNVTVDAKALSSADRMRAVTGQLEVTGAEPKLKTIDIHSAILSGELRFRYIPGVTSGSLTFAFNALDASQNLVASGMGATVALQADVAAAVTIAIEALGPGGMPGKKGNGVTCTAAADCASGSCTDGVCCNERCDGVCSSCGLAGLKGLCVGYDEGTDPESECGAKVANNAPGDAGAGDGGGGPDGGGGGAPDAATDAPVIRTPDGGTMTMPAVCGGTCGGKGLCKYPDKTTTCGKPFCNSSSEVASFACDGNGGCGLNLSACVDYACDDGTSACKTRCADLSDCSDTNYCNGSNQCVPKKGNGVACGSPAECRTGFCSQGVCCNTDCTGTGYSCNTSGAVGMCRCPACATGTCTLFYRDSDADGHGDPDPTKAMPGCADASPPAGYIAISDTVKADDCDDADPNVHPGQTAFFTTVSLGKHLFDYDCDGTLSKETPEYPGATCRFCGPTTACDSSTTTCSSASQQSQLSCTTHTYICRFCPIGVTCNTSCTCCGCTGFLVTSLITAGFTRTVDCGMNGSYLTCGTCAAAGGGASSSASAKVQGCR